MGKSSVSVPGLGPDISPSIFLKLLSAEAAEAAEAAAAGPSGAMFTRKLFLASTCVGLESWPEVCLAGSLETLAGGEPMKTELGPELDNTGSGAGTGGRPLLVITDYVDM